MAMCFSVLVPEVFVRSNCCWSMELCGRDLLIRPPGNNTDQRQTHNLFREALNVTWVSQITGLFLLLLRSPSNKIHSRLTFLGISLWLTVAYLKTSHYGISKDSSDSVLQVLWRQKSQLKVLKFLKKRCVFVFLKAKQTSHRICESQCVILALAEKLNYH